MPPSIPGYGNTRCTVSGAFDGFAFGVIRGEAAPAPFPLALFEHALSAADHMVDAVQNQLVRHQDVPQIVAAHAPRMGFVELPALLSTFNELRATFGHVRDAQQVAQRAHQQQRHRALQQQVLSAPGPLDILAGRAPWSYSGFLAGCGKEF